MKRSCWTASLAVIRINRRPLFPVWPLLLASMLSLSAEPALAPIANTSPAGSTQSIGSDDRQPLFTGKGAADTTAQQAPFQWGPIDLRPHLLYRIMHGDGIQSIPGRQLSSWIQNVSPGVLLDLGADWNVDYTPTWSYYSNRAFRDTFEQAANLNGQAAYGDLALQFTQTYVESAQALIETGGQTDQKNYATTLSASYRFDPKIWLNMTASQNVQLTNAVIPTQSLADFREWSTIDFVHYRFSAQLDIGLGGSAGYVAVYPGADMTYTRPQVQLNWQASDKISFKASGGYETRKFRTHDARKLNNPALEGAIQYQPFQYTKLTVGAGRTTSASYFAYEVSKNTRWNVDLEQRLLQRFYLSAGIGRQKNQYLAATSRAVASREDEAYFSHVRLHTSLLRRGTVAIFYQKTRNSTNIEAYRFSSDQVGCEIGYRY
jgi:hypothetical protein